MVRSERDMTNVAVVQMISSSSIKNNLDVVERFLINACEKQASLVVLPENFAFMGKKETDKLQIAESFSHGDIQTMIAGFAKKYKLWIIAGTIPIKGRDNRVHG